MKFEVGKTYRSNVTQPPFPRGAEPLWETWSVLAEIDGDCFVALHNRPGQALYRVFGPDGVCLDNTSVGTTRKLLPNIVKKKGWIARLSSSNLIGIYAYPSEDAARAAYPAAGSYHEIEWEEEE